MSDNLKAITCGEIHSLFEDIQKTDTAIWRKNTKGEFVVVRPEMIQQLFEKQDWERQFYIDSSWVERLNTLKLDHGEQKGEEPGEDIPEETSVELAPAHETATTTVRDDGSLNSIFSTRMDRIQTQSMAQRNAILDKNIEIIKNRNAQEHNKPLDIIKECIKIVTDFFMVALTTMKDHQENAVSDQEMLGIIKKTDSFIDEIVTLLRKNSIRYSDLNIIEKMSINSPTFDHISKVFLRYILFGFYYDKIFQDGRIDQIESSLPKYLPYYQRLQPGTKAVSLEDLGMKRISRNIMKRYTLGVLLHDVGKFLHIDYHEGNLPYSREKVVGHAALGYNMLIKMRVIPQDVAALAALHHEYYGDSSGYGVSRFLFPVVKEKLKSPKPVFHRFISMDFEDVKNARAMAYFPAKVLEIHDIFDGLTNRSKERHHSHDDALNIMQEDFLDKAVKIDPVLFDIFRSFIREYYGSR